MYAQRETLKEKKTVLEAPKKTLIDGGKEPTLLGEALSAAELVATGQLCLGYDRIAGTDHQAAMRIDKSELFSEGGSSELYCEVLSGSSRIKKAMSVKGNFGASIAGIFNFEASGEARQRIEISSFGVTIAVMCDRCQLVGGSKSFRLIEELPTLDSPESCRVFVAGYGDSYVSQVKVGGKLLATFSMKANSREHQTSLAAKVDGSGLIKALFIEGKAQAAIDNFQKTNNVHITVACTYSGVKNFAPKSFEPQDIIDFSRKFLRTPLNNPVVIGGSLSGYENVSELSTDFKPIAHNRDALLDSFWTNQALQVKTCNEQIQQVKDFYKFHSVNMEVLDKKLYAMVEPAKKDLIRMSNVVLDYRKQPGGTIPDLEKVPELPSLAQGIPCIFYDLSEDAEYGGKRGAYFDDVERGIPQRIAKLELWGGPVDGNYPYLLQIKVKYKFLHNGKPSCEITHGSSKNVTPRTMDLGEDDYIESIRLRSGLYVDWVEFFGPRNKTIKAGADKRGKLFPPLLAKNTKFPRRLVAFQGRSGNWVDMLRPYWCNIYPAKWNAV